MSRWGLVDWRDNADDPGQPAYVSPGGLTEGSLIYVASTEQTLLVTAVEEDDETGHWTVDVELAHVVTDGDAQCHPCADGTQVGRCTMKACQCVCRDHLATEKATPEPRDGL